MFQVRIHGRGGQGVVTAAELLSVAAFEEGSYAQAFPTFGSERTGAPVVAFCRIDAKPIRLREPIVDPDALVVQDPTLVHQVDLFGGLGSDGFILINTTRTVSELGWMRSRHGCVPNGSASCLRPSSRGSTLAAPCPTRRCSARSPR
jgi:pyruvate ferredoxin oxidoreductase gamma subunit